ncbi:7536_t:CDS:2, partial [Scutellospora calospora]
NMTAIQIVCNLLAPTNGASKNELKEVLDNTKLAYNEIKIQHLLEHDTHRFRDNISPWTRLHELQPDSEVQDNNYKHYYQLTLNRKYDLNNDHALILVLTVEDQASYSSSIAIGFSNKKNQFIICIAVEAVQKNIPCTQSEYSYSFYYIDLPNNKGFQCIRQCNSN